MNLVYIRIENYQGFECCNINFGGQIRFEFDSVNNASRFEKLSYYNTRKSISIQTQAKKAVRKFSLTEVYKQAHKRETIVTAAKTIKPNKAYKQQTINKINNDFDTTNISMIA